MKDGPDRAGAGGWDWAAIGVDGRRARGEASSRAGALEAAFQAVGPILLVEVREPDGEVRRAGRFFQVYGAPAAC